MKYKIIMSLFTAPLLSFATVHEISKMDALNTVINSNDTSVVLFHTPQCHHCRNFQKPYEQGLQEEKRDGYKVNAAHDEFKEVVRKFNIRGYPTTIVFHNGKEQSRMVGAYPQKDFQEFLKKNPTKKEPIVEVNPKKETTIKVVEKEHPKKQSDNLLQELESKEKEVKTDIEHLHIIKRLEDLAKAIEDEAIIIFHAKWCPACNRTIPKYRAHVNEKKAQNAYEVDVDDIPGVQKYNIRYLPTAVHYKKGVEVARAEGGGEKLEELYKKIAK